MSAPLPPPGDTRRPRSAGVSISTKAHPPAPPGRTFLESAYSTLDWLPTAGGSAIGLDAGNLFLLVCREAFRDGIVDAGDDLILRRLQRFLRLDGRVVRRLFLRARSEFFDGQLPLSGELERPKVFRKACQLAWVGGSLGPEALRLLEGLALALELPREERDAVFLEVQARLRA